MNFNYRDFFIHNDDLHIIKEQLSIIEIGGVIKQDALEPNAKAVWDAHQTGSDEQTIAAKLKIDVETVKKIIKICLMHTVDKKSVNDIVTELSMNIKLIQRVLSNALASEWKRGSDSYLISDALEIYNLHKKGKSPEEIVKSINQNRKPHLQIKLDKVNLILKIVDIAEKQMKSTDKMGVLNIKNIRKQIDNKISDRTITKFLKIIALGEIRYKHKFTEEQDAFILYNYLQKQILTQIAELFNKKFSTDSIKLKISAGTIHYRLKHNILEPKGKGETDISKEVDELLKIYKDTYFQAVNINDTKTKERLTNYIPPETVRGRDRTGTNRDMSAHLGTLPKNFNTMLPPYYKS